jgi:hypothetical protein
MATRVQIAVLALIALLVAWSANSQRAVVSEVNTISERLSLLEERAEGLASRRAGGRMGKSGPGRRMRRAKAQAVLNGEEASNSADTGAPRAGAAELTLIKEELRDEIAGMVADEQEEAHADRRAMWRSRMVDGLRESVADFVEDRGIDEAVGQQIQSMIDQGIKETMQLHDEMEADEISWYEFRKEMKANRESLEAELAGMVSDEDYDALMELFPRRH